MNYKAWGKAVLVSGLITVAGILIMAFVMYRMRLGDDVMGFPVAAIYGLAAFCGGFVVGRKAPGRRFLWGLGYGASFFAIMLLVSLLSGGSIQGTAGELWMPVLISLGGGMLGGMIS